MTKVDEEANEELLEHLKVIDAGINVEPRPTLGARFAHAWKPLKVKAALAHIGLMISLAVYCVVGGFVSSTTIYSNFVLSPLSSTRLTPCSLLPLTRARARSAFGICQTFIQILHVLQPYVLSPSSKDDFYSFQQQKMLVQKTKRNFHSTECRRQSVCVSAKHEGIKREEKLKSKLTNGRGETAAWRVNNEKGR